MFIHYTNFDTHYFYIHLVSKSFSIMISVKSHAEFGSGFSILVQQMPFVSELRNLTVFHSENYEVVFSKHERRPVLCLVHGCVFIKWDVSWSGGRVL